MSTPEGGIQTADVSAIPDSSAAPAIDSSSVSQGSSTPSSIANGATIDVQGQNQSTTTESDPLQGVPSLDELNQLPDTAQYKKSLIQLRGAYESLKPQFEELTQKFSPFQPVLDRFEKPDDLQSILQLSDSLIGWTNDPQTGEPIPSVEQGVQQLAQRYPQHADFIAADLLNMPTIDPETGRQAARIDFVLEEMAADPVQRAKVLKLFGAVEPSSIAPKWQPSEEELSVVREDLRDIYRTLPYEDREELRLASPEYINKTLANEKLMQELKSDREQSLQQQQQQAQQREQYVSQQAQAAAEQHVSQQLTDALTTFHQSVVDQCRFIEPLDPANLPQGVTPDQAQQVNQQITAANTQEAALVTGTVLGLLNPQVRSFILPMLKATGAIDDKFVQSLDAAASAFGNNARNYGQLSYRQRLQANGNGYQPGEDVTRLNNEATRNLKLMVHYANQLKAKLIDQRAQFFSLKAQGHNATLNGAAGVRPQANGTGFNPTTAPLPKPSGWLTRAEINQNFG